MAVEENTDFEFDVTVNDVTTPYIITVPAGASSAKKIVAEEVWGTIKNDDGTTKEIPVPTFKVVEKDKEELMNNRVKIWGELDFLHAKLVEMFQNPNYNPEYTKVTDLSLEYEMVLAENAKERQTFPELQTVPKNADDGRLVAKYSFNCLV